MISLLGQNLFLGISRSAQDGFSKNDIEPKILPLPPLEEQYRIVEKIDRLMEKVDRLEKLQKERDRKQLIIHAAASDRLLNAPDKNSFNDAWNFIQNNFNQLYSVKENISELRKAILQLAVMGKLVPQDPNDPPASELLKEIESEKKRLIKEGKIKSLKLIKKHLLAFQLLFHHYQNNTASLPKSIA
jgi:type I restriction enzyme S subunit